MRISVHGIGYGGTVSSVGLACPGRHVVAVKATPSKVDPIQRGLSRLVESYDDALITDGVWQRLLTAMDNGVEAPFEKALSSRVASWLESLRFSRSDVIPCNHLGKQTPAFAQRMRRPTVPGRAQR